MSKIIILGDIRVAIIILAIIFWYNYKIGIEIIKNFLIVTNIFQIFTLLTMGYINPNLQILITYFSLIANKLNNKLKKYLIYLALSVIIILLFIYKTNNIYLNIVSIVIGVSYIFTKKIKVFYIFLFSLLNIVLNYYILNIPYINLKFSIFLMILTISFIISFVLTNGGIRNLNFIEIVFGVVILIFIEYLLQNYILLKAILEPIIIMIYPSFINLYKIKKGE